MENETGQAQKESTIRYSFGFASGEPFPEPEIGHLHSLTLQSFSKSYEFRDRKKYYDPFLFTLKKAFEFADKYHRHPSEAFESFSFRKEINDSIADWMGNIELIPNGQEYACWGPDSPFQRIMHHVYNAFYDEVEDVVKSILTKYKTFDEVLIKHHSDQELLMLDKRLDELDALAININANLHKGTFGVPKDVVSKSLLFRQVPDWVIPLIFGTLLLLPLLVTLVKKLLNK